MADLDTPNEPTIEQLGDKIETLNRVLQAIGLCGQEGVWVAIERCFAYSADGQINSQVKPGYPIPFWGVDSIPEVNRVWVTADEAEAERQALDMQRQALDDGREWPEGSDQWFAAGYLRLASKNTERHSRNARRLQGAQAHSVAPPVRQVAGSTVRARAPRTRRAVARVGSSRASPSSPSSSDDESEPPGVVGRLRRALVRLLGRLL